jgi:hypothetical protein
MSSGDKDARSFYDWILVAEEDDEDEVPIEALFQDLPLAGLIFPLNKWTLGKWNEAQCERVKEGLGLVDLRDMQVFEGGVTSVVGRFWNGGGGIGRGGKGLKLVEGKRYRISPRIVDFNGGKILSGLVECDLRYHHPLKSTSKSRLENVPFLHMILDPHSFSVFPSTGTTGGFYSERLRKEEGVIQKLFRELGSLGVKGAKNLVLKDSQREAMRRILTGRLSVVWGPPGSVFFYCFLWSF